MSDPRARWSHLRGGLPGLAVSPGEEDGVGLGFEEESLGKSSGGESTKQYKLFYLGSNRVGPSLGWICGGVLGGQEGHQARFCLKEVKGVNESCGVKHRQAVGPGFRFERNNLYIKSGANAAFCVPTVGMDRIDEDVMSHWMMEKKTASEWCSLFATVQAASEVSSSGDVARRLDLLSGSVGVKTPGRFRLVEESTSLSPFELVSLAKTTPDKREDWGRSETYPRGLARAFFRTEDALCEVAEQLDSHVKRTMTSESGLSEDIERVSVRLSRVENVTGMGIGVRELPREVGQDLESFKEEARKIVSVMGQDLEERHRAQMERVMEDCEVKVKAVLQKMDEELEFVREHVVDPLYDRVARLERENQRMEAALKEAEKASVDPRRSVGVAWSSVHGNASLKSKDEDERSAQIESLINRMSKFERDMKSEVIKFGSVGVTCYREMMVWVEKHIPDNRFGCFVDGVSVFQFLNTSYASFDLKTYESVERLGLHSQQDARVMTSFQNTLPAVFGNDEDAGSLPLPKMTKPAKWSNLVMGSGVKESIRDNFESAKVQVRAQIQLLKTREAQILAEACLSHSELFILALSEYYSKVYDELLAGGYASESAWTLSCKLIRRVFDRIGEVRVCARDGKMRGDDATTTMLILYATLRAHDVMDEFIQSRFENHPTISSEYVKFLARNSTSGKMGEAMKGVTKLTGQVDALETALKAHKQLCETRLVTLEKSRGDGKGKQGGDPKKA